jgi:hypothetical protein
MFYAVCGALKNRDRIQPKLDSAVIKSAMRHPLTFGEIIRFNKYKYVNLGFYVISVLPAGLSVSIIKFIGKKKKYIP